mgnify:CR=1 FL=1
MLNIRPVSDLRNKYPEIEAKMTKAVTVLEEQLHTLRAGRANPSVLDKITVDYYGVATPIQQVANISVPEARMIQIQPWEKKMIKEIEKAINMSELGINPNNDGKVIRLVFPELTEERRKEIAKSLKTILENSKVAMRNGRRDAIDDLRQLEKDNIISEDETKYQEKEVQKMLDEYTQKLDVLYAAKEKEIMEV